MAGLEETLKDLDDFRDRTGRRLDQRYGHDHERWVRQDGAWKIAALKLTRLHIDVRPTQGADAA